VDSGAGYSGGENQSANWLPEVAPVSRPAVLAASTPPAVMCGSGDPHDSRPGGRRYLFVLRARLQESPKPPSTASVWPVMKCGPVAKKSTA